MKISKEPEKTLVSITAILALAIVVVFWYAVWQQTIHGA